MQFCFDVCAPIRYNNKFRSIIRIAHIVHSLQHNVKCMFVYFLYIYIQIGTHTERVLRSIFININIIFIFKFDLSIYFFTSLADFVVVYDVLAIFLLFLLIAFNIQCILLLYFIHYSWKFDFFIAFECNSMFGKSEDCQKLLKPTKDCTEIEKEEENWKKSHIKWIKHKKKLKNLSAYSKDNKNWMQ